MPRLAILLLVLMLSSCNDSEKKTMKTSIQLASMKCDKSTEELTWLRDLITMSQSDASLAGSIYAGTYNGSVVFVHQPMVMSCLACVIYDCDGNKLDASTMNHEQLRLLINDWHRIYSPG